MRRRSFFAAPCALLPLAGCGYHVGGKAALLPASIHTIAIPAFNNLTTRYRLSEAIPGAITREFLTRTRYRIVVDPGQADAVLTGAIVNTWSAPTIFDQATGRASGVQISIVLSLTLTERASGKVLFARQNMEARGRYEIASDPQQYFDESSTALERVSREVARQVVSSILEAF